MLNHEKRSIDIQGGYDFQYQADASRIRYVDPNLLVVVPIGALLERNTFPVHVGGDIWKPSTPCDNSRQFDRNSSYSSAASYGPKRFGGMMSSNKSVGGIAHVPKKRSDCGCRCLHSSGGHLNQGASYLDSRPILNLNDFIDTGPSDSGYGVNGHAHASHFPSQTHQTHDRKRLNLFTSLKLATDQGDCEDDQSDADSLLSSISREISKFDGCETRQTLSPKAGTVPSKIYSNEMTVSCTTTRTDVDRYTLQSGDDSPWNLPN